MSVNVRPFRGGRWLVDVRVNYPDGTVLRDRKVMGGTKLQARNWGVGREREALDQGGKPKAPEKPPTMTFAAFVTEWWPTYETKGLRPTTIRAMRMYLRIHLLPYFGDVPLDEIGRETLDKFVSSMFTKTKGKTKEKRTSRNGYLEEPKGLSAKTVKHAVNTLKSVLTQAVEWGKLEKLPKFPKVRTDGDQPLDFYNPVECERLLKGAANEEQRLWLLFALHTGARAGEQLALEWGDLDLVAKRVDIRRSRSDGVTHATPKTRKGRSVPLSALLHAGLKGAKHLKGSLVFCQPTGKPLTLFMLHGALIRATRKAGLRLLRWHDLRHSFASNLTGGGTPLKQVQEWLGHSTITMTMRYAHLAPGGGAQYLEVLTQTASASSPVPSPTASAQVGHGG